jgi:hypothetical protein
MKTCTRFADLCGGGFQKVPHKTVYVPLPQGEAEDVFEAFFGVDSSKHTCNCCGPDFAVYEETFEDDETPEGFVLTKEVFLQECDEQFWPKSLDDDN